LLDWTIFLGHVALIIFNMFGWIWSRTRLLHLITLGLTAFSWLVLGAWYGWGYCFCTDYHARILEQLNDPGADVTFIQLMFQRLFRIELSQPAADGLAVSVFVLILLATATVWVRPWLSMSGRKAG
jgi:hypothetical protein